MNRENANCTVKANVTSRKVQVIVMYTILCETQNTNYRQIRARINIKIAKRLFVARRSTIFRLIFFHSTNHPLIMCAIAQNILDGT